MRFCLFFILCILLYVISPTLRGEIFVSCDISDMHVTSDVCSFIPWMQEIVILFRQAKNAFLSCHQTITTGTQGNANVCLGVNVGGNLCFPFLSPFI